jgi:hypothetical protein
MPGWPEPQNLTPHPLATALSDVFGYPVFMNGNALAVFGMPLPPMVAVMVVVVFNTRRSYAQTIFLGTGRHYTHQGETGGSNHHLHGDLPS